MLFKLLKSEVRSGSYLQKSIFWTESTFRHCCSLDRSPFLHLHNTISSARGTVVLEIMINDKTLARDAIIC